MSGMPRKAAKNTVKKKATAKKKTVVKGKAAVKEKIPVAKLLVNRAVVEKGYEELAEKAYGKNIERRLELSFVETLYLLQKKRIELKRDSQKINFR